MGVAVYTECLKFISYLFLSYTLGCAAISSNGTLNTINQYPNIPKNKKSLTIRSYLFVNTYFNGVKSDFIRIEHSPEFSEKMLTIFKNSNAFSDIKIIGFSSKVISSNTKNAEFLDSLIDEPIRNIQTDYFIDIIVTSDKYIGKMSMRQLLFIPSLITLGLIPYSKPNESNVIAKIYSKVGTQVNNFSIHDNMTIWYWTPLLISSETKVFSTDFEIQEPNLIKSVQNLLNQSLQAGVFK